MPPSNPFTPALDSIITKALEDWHCPGLSVSVTHEKQTWSKGYGLANLSPEQSVQSDTLFYAASTTKAQLAAVWAIYIHSEANTSKPEEERIEWSTPLVNIIPTDFVLEDTVTTRQVTLEDALSHRTGMPRHDFCYGKEGPSTPRDVTRHLRHLPLHNALRTQFEYCNVMYIAASHALETLTGKPLADIFREWLWQPLRMGRTYAGYGEAVQAVREKGEVLATSYQWTKMPTSPDYAEGEYERQESMDFPESAGAGYVISTAEDWRRWMLHLLSPNSAGPLTEEMRKELWTPRSVITEAGDMSVPFDGGMGQYALGWFVTSYKGYMCYWHPGGNIGAGSLVMLVPDLQWGMGFFCNGNDSGMSLRGLPFAVLDQVLGLPQAEQTGMQKVEAATMKVYAEIADENKKEKETVYPTAPAKSTIPLSLPIEDYAGTYRNKAYGRLTFSVARKPGDEETKVLTFLANNKCWTSQIRLEHVNAEFWLGRRDAVHNPVKKAFRAETRVGVDGKVQWMGLVMEEAMPERLFWFERQD